VAVATDFDTSINDTSAPIAVDFKSDRHVLLLAFGGLAGGLGFPMFEFSRLTSGLENTNRIFLRDPRNAWYHQGLPGISDSVDGVVSFLKQYTGHGSTQRSIAVGNSGGGYAAMLFGHLLGVDAVHAFSPKTFIDPFSRMKIRDFPPRFEWNNWLRLLSRGERRYFDLKRVLQKAAPPNRAIHVYYAAHHRIDRLHATRIESLPGVRAYPHPGKEHALIKDLKRSGELARIIERAVAV
jgi:hypothetical protein